MSPTLASNPLVRLFRWLGSWLSCWPLTPAEARYINELNDASESLVRKTQYVQLKTLGLFGPPSPGELKTLADELTREADALRRLQHKA